MRKFIFILSSLSILFSNVSFSQKDNETGVIQCESFKVSRPLRDLLIENPVSEKKIARQNMRKKNGESKDKIFDGLPESFKSKIEASKTFSVLEFFLPTIELISSESNC